MANGYIRHKEYIGAIEVDTETGCLFANALGLRDVITAQGETVAELKAAFADSIEDYIEFCAEQGIEPEKPVSGQVPARVGAVRHYRLKRLSVISKRSINELISTALEAELDRMEDELKIHHDVPAAIAALELEKTA